MEKIFVSGGVPLTGTVRISGSKNSSLAVMAGALLAEGPSILRNVPNIGDIHTMVEMLQAIGIAAGAAQNAQDLAECDPQIEARGTFFELDHPVIGPALFEGTPIKFSRTTQQNWRSGPLLGEDNHYVYGELLGLSEDEISDLEDEGVI